VGEVLDVEGEINSLGGRSGMEEPREEDHDRDLDDHFCLNFHFEGSRMQIEGLGQTNAPFQVTNQEESESSWVWILAVRHSTNQMSNMVRHF
jgi:hypothetical protein